MIRFPRLTMWRSVFLAVMAAGAYATYARVVHGLAGSTNLNDRLPWGIWVGFDILCGVGLATGGLTISAIVYAFNLRSFEPIVRPAVLTAFLGYLLEVAALAFDLGRPDRMWHTLVMWNPRSVMFEVSWCVTLCTMVLFLLFLPPLLERLGLRAPLRRIRNALVPLVILGALLSAVHQMMLGSLYLIAPHKLHPLWYSPHLPVFFYLSAVCAGLAVTVFESWHTSAALRTRMEVASLARISRLAAVLLLFYSLLRILDLWHRGAWGMAFDLRPEAGLFHIEVWLMLLPAVWLLRPSAKSNPRVLYGCSVAILMGFLAQRLNVSITAMQAVSDAHYLPKWTELAVTFSMVALGFAMFGFAARHLPLFAAPRAVSRA